ncbi:hypothetical protein [Thiocapsa sp.]|uniref:hypothetical protein n=1 Tax=Thiocapsa sp. TaxID=2024551 RepID=UPI0025F6D039|nr:hypothetical protein [Thiocapsa sp.]
MTKYTLAIAASLFAITAFATTAIADDVYHGLARGNADLFDGHRAGPNVVGVQPGVGDRHDIYAGLADGNSDLFSRVEAVPDSGSRPDIYQGFEGSADLSY